MKMTMIGRGKSRLNVFSYENNRRIKRGGFWGLIFGLVFVAFTPLRAEHLPESRSLNKRNSENLILMTVPKSGTHLMAKLIYLMTGQKSHALWTVFGEKTNNLSPEIHPEYFIGKLDHCFKKNKPVHAHLNYGDLVQDYIDDCHKKIKQAPKVAVLVRDPRDIYVSLTHFIYEPLKRAMGGSPSFDEVLLWTIHNGYGEHEGGKWDIPWFLDKLQEWVDRPGTVLFRFEELCGQCGGGSREAQFAAFHRLGRLLDIELTERECILMSKELFGKSQQGISWTFRSGQIGSWKEHFKPEHIDAFKEELGEVLIKLGYEDDYDW